MTRWTYGTHTAQYADLYRPSGSPRRGLAVVIHGGFWRSTYDATLGAPLCADLAARGYTAWNLEYRRVGDGGGWPATCVDVATGIDRLGTVADLDTSAVVTIGHSAGGQLAVWTAGRQHLPSTAPGASPTVRVIGAVSQAGVLSLSAGAQSGLGGGAIRDLMGGTPPSVPGDYELADPIQQLPLGVPVRAVHARDDDIVPFEQSASYVSAAIAAGDDAQLTETVGGHFGVIDVEAAGWAATVAAFEELVGRQ